jgi:hypothetical protein
MEPSEGERACFEAGIKFGTLYHQFVGTPVSPETAEGLARAIEESIENQPFCSAVRVTIPEGRLREAIRTGPDTDGGYTEFTGEFADVEVEIEYEDTDVLATMELEDGYPLMRLESVEGP